MKFIPIPDIKAFQGPIPEGHDLIVYESGTDPLADKGPLVLLGFDEVGLVEVGLVGNFRNPAYGFVVAKF